MFLQGINDVFRESEFEHRNRVDEFKGRFENIYSDIQKRISEKNYEIDKEIENIISEMWIDEILGLYSICNAAILADLYFKVVSSDNTAPPFYQSANIDLCESGLKSKMTILSHYCACLCFMGYKYGKNRDTQVILYRGVGNSTQNKYKIKKEYRFVTFQSCSEDINKTVEYMKGGETSIYTIHLPIKCRSGFYIHRKGNEQVRKKEYIVVL